MLSYHTSPMDSFNILQVQRHRSSFRVAQDDVGYCIIALRTRIHNGHQQKYQTAWYDKYFGVRFQSRHVRLLDVRLLVYQVSYTYGALMSHWSYVRIQQWYLALIGAPFGSASVDKSTSKTFQPFPTEKRQYHHAAENWFPACDFISSLYGMIYDMIFTRPPPQHTSTWQVATVRQNRKGWASSVLHLTPCTRVMSCHGNHGRRGVGARFSNFKSLARGHYKVDAARQLRWRPTGGRSPTWRIRFAHYGTYPESLVENAFQQTTTKLIPSDVQLFYTRYLQKQKI